MKMNFFRKRKEAKEKIESDLYKACIRAVFVERSGVLSVEEAYLVKCKEATKKMSGIHLVERVLDQEYKVLKLKSELEELKK